MDRIYIPFELVEFETKSNGSKPKGWFKGYGSTFGNVDLGKDVVLPGAFDQTVEEHKKSGTVPAMFYEHNTTEPVGDWLGMEVDKKGLLMEGQLWVDSGIPRAEQSYKMLGSKTGRGLSMGYNHIEPPIYDDRKGIRQLTKLRVNEVSVTGRPMNQKCGIVSVKALLEDKKILTVREAEDWLRDAVGLSATEAKTFIAAVKSGAQAERDASLERQKSIDSTLERIKTLRKQITSTP